MIMDHKEDEQEPDLSVLVRANLKKLPILIASDKYAYRLPDR